MPRKWVKIWRNCRNNKLTLKKTSSPDQNKCWKFEIDHNAEKDMFQHVHNNIYPQNNSVNNTSVRHMFPLISQDKYKCSLTPYMNNLNLILCVYLRWAYFQTKLSPNKPTTGFRTVGPVGSTAQTLSGIYCEHSSRSYFSHSIFGS